MRPLPGDDAFVDRAPGASSEADLTPLATRAQAPQMSYFMADEKTMESSQSQPPALSNKPREPKKSSLYGIESMETTISSLARDSDEHDDKLVQARNNWRNSLTSKLAQVQDKSSLRSESSRLSQDASRDVSPSHRRRPSNSASRPFTPMSCGSHAPPSLLSSPSSRRNSDSDSRMDDRDSQAIMSSGEEDERDVADMTSSGSAPQLVMPSIRMPSRRPFTETGRNMGRLKVLIAGDSEVGKTSLIKAIVQTCEHIVHVDPLSSSAMTSSDSMRQSGRLRRGSTVWQTTSQITEVYASTRAYPSWWSDFDESRVLKRRKSMGDSVLERNLCFVDTPGYGKQTSCLEAIAPVVNYVESHLQKLASNHGLADSDCINMLGGSGGSQVDVVFYMISEKVKSVDIEYLRRLSPMTNIIPLVAMSDSISEEQLLSLKSSILNELQAAGIRPFLFGLSPEDALRLDRPHVPFAISTSAGKDLESMDASLLMSPDYVQPMVRSELNALVEQVFERDTISWLRNSAAKKFIQWRNNINPNKHQSLYQPFSSSRSTIASSSQITTVPVGQSTSYALARITDHTIREERLAQIRLSNWAADLQRSLQNERARFDALARNERAVWLTERLGECVQDGTIVPMSEARQQLRSGPLVKHDNNVIYSRKRASGSALNLHDPLGILSLSTDLKRKGKGALKIISGITVLGGLAIWILRKCEWSRMQDATMEGLLHSFVWGACAY